MTTLDDLARVEREIREQARENFKWRLNRIARDKAGWADTIAAYIAAQRERDAGHGGNWTAAASGKENSDGIR